MGYRGNADHSIHLKIVRKKKTKNVFYMPENAKLVGFEEAARPLIKWLNENCHPHVSVIVTPTNAELLEGLISTGEIMDYVKD